MNQITETTKATISSIKTHALLSKALLNDAKPTPGYLFPEIAKLTQSPATSAIVLSQLLKTITPTGYVASSTFGNVQSTRAGSATSTSYSASVHVLLKALKILRQLTQVGSVDFRVALARQGKSLLAEMVGYRGPWDDIHGDRYNQDVRAAAEELIEYMHANPVQENEKYDMAYSLTAKEAEVLQSSTQDLQGFGNPEYDDDSDSPIEGNLSSKNKSRMQKPKQVQATPPLPGFGNPAFETDSSNSEPTLMARFVDRLQELTAPPPPIAMREAYRRQEQRRHKLFVGEYSMGEAGRSNQKNSMTNVGTNPFRRTARAQGVAAGGWAGRGDVLPEDADPFITSRVFPLQQARASGAQPYRSTASETVYALAQYIQTDLVRSKFCKSSLDAKTTSGSASLMVDGVSTNSDLGQEETDDFRTSFPIWGTAQDICDVVLYGISSDKSSGKGNSTTEIGPESSATPVITGLLRDLNEWIDNENWERRLRYLFVLDTLLAHPQIEASILSCSALAVLSKTLQGPRCCGASQLSVQSISSHLSQRTRSLYMEPSMPDKEDNRSSDTMLSNIMLLDIDV